MVEFRILKYEFRILKYDFGRKICGPVYNRKVVTFFVMLWALFCGQGPGVALMIIFFCCSLSCSGLFYCSVGLEDPAVYLGGTFQESDYGDHRQQMVPLAFEMDFQEG